MQQNLAKILFVEDSKNEFTFTNMLFARENLHIDMEFARSIEDIKSFTSNTKPDLIIVDNQIACFNKNQILKFFNKNSARTPIIVMIGIDKLQIDNNDTNNFSQKNTFFLQKPLSLDKLQNVIKKIKNLSFHCKENKIYLYKKFEA